MHSKFPTLRSLEGLEEAGLLCGTSEELRAAEARQPIAITQAMLALIDREDPQDPIALQFVPKAEELRVGADELADPIGDEAYSPVEGIVHRYPDRVLLKLLHICPVYCRFCFRREQVGPDGGILKRVALDRALDYIAAHPDIWEVILTGGDPLMLSADRLKDAIGRLNAIPHVKILRVHTRVPVVDPARITPELVEALRGAKPLYVLLHCNHARELTDAARDACARLVDAGMPMLSQSVLLRGVNDSAAALRDLMRAFVETRVKPHYVHLLDRARGTSHFRVPLAEAQELMRALRGHISGLCQPALMLDIPGGAGKVPVGPEFAAENDGDWVVEDFRGRRHRYCDGEA
jgi:lysine 2,3-aminomutase